MEMLINFNGQIEVLSKNDKPKFEQFVKPKRPNKPKREAQPKPTK